MIFLCCKSYSQEKSDFSMIYNLLNQKKYFKAQILYQDKKKYIKKNDQIILEIILDNSFNRLKDSESLFKELNINGVSDSILLKLYKTQEDTASKLYDYKKAKLATEIILNKFKYLLSEHSLKKRENDLKLWSALENIPKQTTTIKTTTQLKIKKDKADLNTLLIHIKSDSLMFVLDTGANFSVVSKRNAERMNMSIIKADIEIGSITKKRVIAQLAICPLIILGNIEIKNSIFFVVEDDALNFPEFDYKISGILGNPIIQSFKEIQITHDNFFIVPKKQTCTHHTSNLAMDRLTPLVYIDGKLFLLDTGAQNSILYSYYYTENKDLIDRKYKLTKTKIGGVGGIREFDGYSIDYTLNLQNKKIILAETKLLYNTTNHHYPYIYGNLGQDFIHRFNKVIINFEKMFIRFES